MKIGNTRCMQYLASVIGGLSITTAALYAAWPSPILPKIASGNSPLGNITNQERSWIVSSFALGHIPGSIISGVTLETFGRRGSLVLSGLPILLPWFVLAFSSSVWMVCAARFIAGAALSNAISALTLYNGEIAEKEIRGRSGSSFNILGLSGEIIVFCIGPYISYTALALISSTVPLIFVIAFYFMPESPYYLMKIGKEAEARKNLKVLLRNDIKDVEFEEQVSVIKRSVDEDLTKETSLWEFLSKKEYHKFLLLALGINTLHQLSGFLAVLSYMQTIIQNSESSITPEMSSLICGLVQFPAVLITAAIVDRVGRKPLLIISSLGCALALVIEGIYFYVQDVIQADVGNFSWLPTSGILLYVVMRPVGIGTVTFVLMGELFAPDIKGHAMAVSSVYNNILAFIVAKTFEPVSKEWGMHVMFALFSSVCVLGALFAYFILPETKGKTLVEIMEKINKKNKKISYDNVIKST